VDLAFRAIFDAYDIDESGELDRNEFLQIEMRLAFDRGELVKEAPLFAKLTLSDVDHSGQISFEEFRSSQMREFSAAMTTKEDIIKKLEHETRVCLLERQKMGPRYHTGIRAELRRIFQLYDTSGDASLSPQEWIAAQKIVAMELSDDLDDGWINEAAFKAADTNGDGVLSESEYLEASFSMFEVCKMNMAQLMKMLGNIVSSLETKLGKDSTHTLSIMMPAKEKPDFQPPSIAWQNEKTDEDDDSYKQVGEIKLPTNLSTVAEVISLVRLSCGIKNDTWLSIFFLGPNPGDPGTHQVTLLRDGNTQAALDYLSKDNAKKKLHVKNVRPKPSRLTLHSMAFLDDRDALLAKRTGNCWGIDWETQLVGEGSKLPPAGSVPIVVGDALVVEVPSTDGHGEFTYVASIWMDGAENVSRPVEEVIEPKVKKKKKKKGAAAEEEKPPDNLMQLSFVGLQEGKCVLFVDISWEEQECRLCSEHSLVAPVKENTIARIGPIEVDVQKPVPGAPKEKTFMWWNGDKWTAKKGPAKKKGKK
jgi:Ca2+-binding EF-hand superfamily protein